MANRANNIVVVPDVQENYIVQDREINENPDPKFDSNILVTNDHLSNRLFFNMYYTFDDRELEDKEIKIVWTNANNEKGMSLCVDKELTGDRLSFAWNVPIEATYKEGTVKFAVRITSGEYVWNSLIGTVEVKQGIVTEEFNDLEEAQSTPGWVDYIEGKYKVALQTMTEDEYEALPVKSNDVIYVVTMNDLSINMYQGSKQISGGGGGGGSGATFQVLTRTQWKALQNKEEGTFYVVTDVIGGPPGLEENVYSLYFGSYLLCNSGITSNEDSNLLYSKEFKFGANDKSSVKLTMRRSGRVIWYNFWCRFISTSDYEDLVSKINNDNSIFSDIPSMFISNDSASFPIPLTDAGYAASASLNTPTFVMTSNPYEIPHKFYLYNTYQFNSSYIRLGFQNWTGCMLSMRDTTIT